MGDVWQLTGYIPKFPLDSTCELSGSSRDEGRFCPTRSMVLKA